MTDLPRMRKLSLGLGIVALLVCAAGGFLNSTEFFRSWLLGFLFWISIALGSLGVRLLHSVVGGKWGVVVGRFLEAGIRTLPVMALLAIPLLAGIPALYEWSHSDVVAHDPILQHKAPYLNLPFFVGRTIFYFAVWLVLWILLQRRERKGYGAGKVVSAPGLIIFSFTVTFAAVDWIMSLEPHWFSTIYGAIFLVGQSLETLAFVVVMLALLSRVDPFRDVIRAGDFHDLGNLLLAFTALWAYTSFSQFLIIWSGNLPEETGWYIRRSNGGWQIVSVVLMAFHFGVPFAALLSRRVKRQGAALARIAVWIMVMRVVDLVYWTEPAFEERHLSLIWMRLAALLGVGGLWLAAFLWNLQQRPLLDLADPRLQTTHGAAH